MKNQLTGEEVKDNDLKSLTTMIHVLEGFKKQRDSIQKLLDTFEDNIKKYSFVLIPDKMNELGLQKFTTSEGLVVETVGVYSGSFVEGKTDEGVEWLEEHGHGGVVKRNVVVPFEKGEDKKVEKIEALLKKEGLGYDVLKSVHHQTFKGLVRELTESGVTLPPTIFKTFVGKQAKVNTK